MKRPRRYAVIEDGQVINTIIASAEFVAEQKLIAVEFGEKFCEIGMIKSGDDFAAVAVVASEKP